MLASTITSYFTLKYRGICANVLADLSVVWNAMTEYLPVALGCTCLFMAHSSSVILIVLENVALGVSEGFEKCAQSHISNFATTDENLTSH